MAKSPPLSFPTPPSAASKPNLTRPRLSRTMGILTVFYAVAMLGYGLFTLAVVNTLPQLVDLLGQVQVEQSGVMNARRQMALKTLDEAEANAATPEARAQIKVDRLLLERTEPAALPMDSIPGLGMFNDPEARTGLNVDTLIKLGINVLFLIAGIGLIRGKPRSRPFALGVCWLKIAALVVLTVISVRTVVGPLARAMTAEVETMIARSLGDTQPPPDTAQRRAGFEADLKRSFTWTYVVLGGLGLAFPILLVVLLHRPKVRAELAPLPVATT